MNYESVFSIVYLVRGVMIITLRNLVDVQNVTLIFLIVADKSRILRKRQNVWP